MADTTQTLADLVTINDKNPEDYGITDLLNDAPVVAAIPALEATNGTSHTYEKRLTEQSVGFRPVNVGLDRTAGTFGVVTEQLNFLDCEHEPVDIAWLQGLARKSPEEVIDSKIASALRAGYFKIEQQLFNGGVGGFTGLKDRYGLTTNAFVIDAGGTNAGTLTSIWLIRAATDGTGVALVAGNDGNITVGDTYQTRVLDGTGKAFTGFVTPAGMWAGMQIGAKWSAVRIANIDVRDTSVKKATDALIYKALKLFPATKRPNIIAMNPDPLEQIRSSRTATTPTGAAAPTPETLGPGIPVILTNAITSTEAVVPAS